METAANHNHVLVTDLGQKQQQLSLCVMKVIHVHDNNNIILTGLISELNSRSACCNGSVL